MINKTKLLDRYKDYEDRILVNNIIEAAEYCIENFTSRCSFFLDPRQQEIAKNVLHSIPDIEYTFDGGISDSERKLCLVKVSDDEVDFEGDLINIIKFTWYHTSKKLSHRDFLGSLIGNGIKREMIGDIILEEETAYLACKSEIADFILLNVSRIGSVPVKLELVSEAVQKNEKTKLISSTVSSMRLDCIISCGYGISRSKALELIKSDRVKVNWEETAAASKEVKEGDTISLRGKGRIVLEEVSGTTKKDRIRITIKRYT